MVASLKDLHEQMERTQRFKDEGEGLDQVIPLHETAAYLDRLNDDAWISDALCDDEIYAAIRYTILQLKKTKSDMTIISFKAVLGGRIVDAVNDYLEKE